MTPSRKKPGVAFWATVVVVVGLVAYPLSFGPVLWLARRDRLPTRATSIAYRPLILEARREWVSDQPPRPILWWATVWDRPRMRTFTGCDGLQKLLDQID